MNFTKFRLSRTLSNQGCQRFKMMQTRNLFNSVLSKMNLSHFRTLFPPRGNCLQAGSFFMNRYQSSATSSSSQDDWRDFLGTFPDIVQDLTEDHRARMPLVTDWQSKVLEYNVNEGRRVLTQAMLQAHRLLCPAHLRTPAAIQDMYIMAWCYTLFGAAWIVEDGMIDGSETRWGKPCWHRRPEVGEFAGHDVLFMAGSIYQLLNKHCRHKPYFSEAVDLFDDMSFKVAVGQTLDHLSSDGLLRRKLTLDDFTMKRYDNILEYKTLPFLHLPFTLAMMLAGISKESRERAAQLLAELAYVFQVENDFVDCYGEAEVTGKIGTDIAGGKCCWTIVTALSKANSNQRAVLQECYGSKEPAKVRAVKDIYDEVKLPQLYTEYMTALYRRANTRISRLPADIHKQFFFMFLDNLYRNRINIPLAAVDS